MIEDIQLISQLTKRIRLYGADCNVPSLVLEAISKTKVDMTVWLAVWVPQPADDPTGATYNRQVSEVVKAIQAWGVDHVGGVTVSYRCIYACRVVEADLSLLCLFRSATSSCSTMVLSLSSLPRWQR